MDNLIIERVWEDADFFEIEVTAQSDIIHAKACSYTDPENIHELASRLMDFAQSYDDRCIWENGVKGDNFTPYLPLEFWCEDKLGHIIVEVYLELDDGAPYSKHNCCFFIRTELGLLNRFGKSLLSLNKPGLGKKIALNPVDA